LNEFNDNPPPGLDAEIAVLRVTLEREARLGHASTTATICKVLSTMMRDSFAMKTQAGQYLGRQDLQAFSTALVGCVVDEVMRLPCAEQVKVGCMDRIIERVLVTVADGAPPPLILEAKVVS
jgi:hypothetical protein